MSYQTRQNVETGYVNILVESEDCYFLITSTSNFGATSGLNGSILIKFDLCRNEVWSKIYDNIKIRDAAIHDNSFYFLTYTDVLELT